MKLQLLILLAFAVFACDGFGIAVGRQDVGDNLLSPLYYIRHLFCGRTLVNLLKSVLSFGNPVMGTLIETVLRVLQGSVCPVPIIQPRLPAWRYYRY